MVCDGILFSSEALISLMYIYIYVKLRLIVSLISNIVIRFILIFFPVNVCFVVDGTVKLIHAYYQRTFFYFFSSIVFSSIVVIVFKIYCYFFLHTLKKINAQQKM